MTRNRWIAAAAAMIMAAAPLAASASAGNGTVLHEIYVPPGTPEVDDSLCAFPVTITNTYIEHDTIFLDADGALARVLASVRDVRITFSANGRTLTAKGSGGYDVTWNADGSTTISTFGIGIRAVVPGVGVVLLDAGRATITFDPHPHVVFRAGPQQYDFHAFCSALT